MDLRTRLIGLLLGAAAMPTVASAGYFIVTPMWGKQVSTPTTPPEITVSLSSAALPVATGWEPYSHDFKEHLLVTGDTQLNPQLATFATGDPLPKGIVLGTDGVLTGTPQVKAGETAIRVMTTYKGKSGEQLYALQVGESKAVVTLAKGPLTRGEVGIAYQFGLSPFLSIDQDDNPDPRLFSWTASDGTQLPEGLALTSDGRLTGTPTKSTTVDGTPIDVSISYKGKDARQVYTLIVDGQPLRATKVAVGDRNACALTPEGAVKCWGLYAYKALGDGPDNTKALDIVQIQGLTSGVTDIVAGLFHYCALQSGAVKCWGMNLQGQIGVGRTGDDVYPPATVVASGATAVAAGDQMSCAVASGGVSCWGVDAYGSMGSGNNPGTVVVRSSPFQIPGLTSGVTKLAAGNYNVCVVHENQTKCWGMNAYGQLGLGIKMDRHVPTVISALAPSWSSVDFTPMSTCALISGKVLCAGSNAQGLLGTGTSDTESTTFVSPFGLSTGVAEINRMGSMAWCAKQGSISKCWGSLRSMWLSSISAQNYVTPTVIPDLNNATSFKAVDLASCAIIGGVVNCSGRNTVGHLGPNGPVDRGQFQPVRGN